MVLNVLRGGALGKYGSRFKGFIWDVVLMSVRGRFVCLASLLAAVSMGWLASHLAAVSMGNGVIKGEICHTLICPYVVCFL